MKRLILGVTVLLVAMLAPLAALGRVPPPADSGKTPANVSGAAFRSSLTKAERDWLDCHAEVTFSDTEWPPLSLLDGVQGTGILGDIYRELSAITGLSFRYVPVGTFDEVIAALKAEKIDLIDGTGRTPERAGYALFAGPFMSFPLAIASRTDSPLGGMEFLAGRRVAVAGGYTAHHVLQERYPAIPLSLVKDSAEALRLVAAGKADAMLDILPAVGHSIEAQGLSNVAVTGLCDYEFKLYAMVRKGAPELAGILDKAFRQIPKRRISQIYQHWIPTTPPLRFPAGKKLELNAEERAWLAAHPVLRVGVHRDLAPLEWVDRRNRLQGISSDLLGKLSTLLGVRFEIVADRSWPELCDMTQAGDVDFLSSAFATPADQAHFRLTEPHVDVRTVMVAKVGVKYVHDIGSLAGRRVAVLAGGASEDYLRRTCPKAVLHAVETPTAGMRALLDDKADLFMLNAFSALYELHRLDSTRLTIIGETDARAYRSMATGHGNAILAGILGKALASIPQTEKNAIIDHWLNLHVDVGMNPELVRKYSLLAGAGFLCVLFFSIGYWNFRLRRAVARWRASEKNLNLTLHSIGDGVISTDPAGRIVQMNPVAERLTGWPLGEAAGRPLAEVFKIVNAHTRQPVSDPVRLVLERGEIVGLANHTLLLARGGGCYQIADSAAPIREGAGPLTGVVLVFHDVTEQYEMQEALRQSGERFKMLFNQAPLGYQSLDADGRLVEVNQTWLEMLGYARGEVEGRCFGDFLAPEFTYSFLAQFPVLKTAGKLHAEFQILHKDGGRRFIAFDGRIGCDAAGVFQQAHCLLSDITALKRAEEEREKLEAQFRQAQKMESVGRLAGGVAHDFNNMLGVIIGQAEMALMTLGPVHPARESLQEIMKAGQRSADLTRQLLAFARKQTISPKVLDLNDVIASMLKMLQRLIGEDINLAWQPASVSCPVKMDPMQIDQILANLTVNARDAISGVGKLSIGTGILEVDGGYCKTHPDALPGKYVCLTVGDNGCGMNPETVAHLFEPFFTTKGVGKGTGLGLATIYGIVKQNHGFIEVDSRQGGGTLFSLFFPWRAAEPGSGDDAETTGSRPTGTETVLLVEDEAAFLMLGRRLLEHLGYTVLAAGSPGEALRLAREYAGEIHLLMTDVVMPEMNGHDLQQQLCALRPNLKCLFMSGYAAGTAVHQAIDEKKLQFLAKPFTCDELSVKLRNALSAQP